MNIKDTLYRLNPWWETDFELSVVSRPKYQDELRSLKSNRDIILITGLRRGGKTTLMKQMILELLQETRSEQICYVSLDAYSLESQSIHDIITAYRTLHRLSRDQKVHVFLDEIAFRKVFKES